MRGISNEKKEIEGLHKTDQEKKKVGQKPLGPLKLRIEFSDKDGVFYRGTYRYTSPEGSYKYLIWKLVSERNWLSFGEFSLQEIREKFKNGEWDELSEDK